MTPNTPTMKTAYTHPRFRSFDYLGTVTSRDTLVRILDAEMPPGRGGRLLDVGCGSALWKPFLMGRIDEYVGLDVKAGPDVSIVASAEAMPIPDHSFDWIFSVSAVEHIPDAQSAMAEMHRVLKPGGVAVIGIPFIWGIHGEPHDYRRWTPHGLKKLAAAFSACEVHQAGNVVTNYLLVQNYYLRLIQEAWPAARFCITPFIMLNNAIGRLFWTGRPTFTRMATFYWMVARK